MAEKFSSGFYDSQSVSQTEMFMTDWTSEVFRNMCADKINNSRQGLPPPPENADPVLVFLSQKSSQELEEFVFNKSTSREDYLAYVMEIVQMFRKHAKSLGLNQDSDSTS